MIFCSVPNVHRIDTKRIPLAEIRALVEESERIAARVAARTSSGKMRAAKAAK